MSTVGIISTYASGVDLVVEWKIENFFNLLEMDGAAYWSPLLLFGGERWELWIYPNGSSRNDSSGHVDLQLWKCNSGRSIKQSFSLSLKTAKGEKYNKQHFTKHFGGNYSFRYKFHRFIPRSELSRRRSELVPEGDLTVICTMKSSTSAASDSDVLSKERNLYSVIPAMSNIRGIISTYACGVDLVVEWKIENFFNLPERDCAAYWSPYFSFGGQSWFLWIWPNGSSRNNSSGHVDLWLCKCASDRSVKQSFSLSLKIPGSEKYNEQRCSKDFDNRNSFHTFNRFIPRSELSWRRSEFVPEGVLTVVCTMKNTTSAGNASNTASTSNQCCHCKVTFSADSLSSHRKKCMRRSIKCPDCLEVVVLRTWIDEHECQQGRPEGEACSSGSSTSPYEKKVVQDLKEFFLQKEDCDVIIKVKGSEIPAHRFILKARSRVFASTFRHNMKESATGVVEIKDCEPAPFSDFLRFLYCGDVGMISQENVFSIFTLADKYEIMDLKAKCLDFMKKNLTVAMFYDTITLALLHSETELITLATDFFVKNAEEILQTDKWQTFVVENPKQSNELFVKFVKSVKHSNV